jgi:Tfp pilus assembly protein PilO
MTLTWEAIGVLAVIAGGVLGWLIGLTSKITSLQADVSYLKSDFEEIQRKSNSWEGLEKRLIRVEERLEVIVKRLEEISERVLRFLEGK